MKRPGYYYFASTRGPMRFRPNRARGGERGIYFAAVCCARTPPTLLLQPTYLPTLRPTERAEASLSSDVSERDV